MSLLRLAKSIGEGTNAQSPLAEQAPIDLRAVTTRAAKIAADLGALIDHDANRPQELHDLNSELHAVRFSILDLDRAIAEILGDRCQTASLLAGKH